MVCPGSLPLSLKRPSTDADGEDVTGEACRPHLLTRGFFSQDGRVFVWTCDDASGNTWSPKLLHKFNDVVWHVSWSITANILAVSGGDNKVSSVTQSRPTPCDPVDCSMPGLPVHHRLPERTQTHVHRVGDTFQPSHPLWYSDPPPLHQHLAALILLSVSMNGAFRHLLEVEL